jgi:hypothetical protein
MKLHIPPRALGFFAKPRSMCFRVPDPILLLSDFAFILAVVRVWELATGSI